MTSRNLTSSFDRYRQENLSSRDVKLLLEPTWTDFYSQANEELERIKFLLKDREQGKTKSCLCIVVLSIVVCILTGILIWKKN